MLHKEMAGWLVRDRDITNTFAEFDRMNFSQSHTASKEGGRLFSVHDDRRQGSDFCPFGRAFIF